jgi:acyl-homoserine-lactone acylase
MGMGGLRMQRTINMIKDDSSVTFNELISYKMNTEMEAAHRFLDDLLAPLSSFPIVLRLKLQPF